MVRCPVCESARVVVVLSPARSAFCVRCNSRWVQEGSYQRAVRKGIRGTAADRTGLSVVRPPRSDHEPGRPRAATTDGMGEPEPTAS